MLLPPTKGCTGGKQTNRNRQSDCLDLRLARLVPLLGERAGERRRGRRGRLPGQLDEHVQKVARRRDGVRA